MVLPVRPPLKPMLARLTRSLPDRGSFVFEPKWDGFRCLAFRDGSNVDLRSRHDRPFARYFPELVDAMLSLPTQRFVMDGEIVLVRDGTFDFEALMSRLHPAASRVERLASEMPATFVAFDLLAQDEVDLRQESFTRRRERLEDLLREAPPRIVLTPATTDRSEATAWLDRFPGGGIDGVIAKDVDLAYQPGRRAMIKVKSLRTAECVVAGYRPYVDAPAVSTLLLGLYDDGGDLHHVGVMQAFTGRERVELVHMLEPLRIRLERHPWAKGFLIGRSSLGRLKGSAARWTPDMDHDWVPLRPELVVEVSFDQVDGTRLRHPARLLRWRPDRDARSCALDQLGPPAAPLLEVLSV